MDQPGQYLKLQTEKIIARKHGGIGWLMLNNPERRNAISLEMSDAIAAAATEFAADPEVRVVILQGAGDRAFSAGADVSEFERFRSDAASASQYRKRSAAAEESLDSLPMPLIAMIRGICFGGGVSLALRADIRLAASNSRFGIPAAKLGIAYPYDHVRRLVHAVGPAVAMELLFTGREIEAAEALSLGLLNRIAEPTALAEAVLAIASQIAANAPLSLRASKTAVTHLTRAPGGDMEEINALAQACNNSEDYREGRRAFMEKRKPVFRGR